MHPALGTHIRRLILPVYAPMLLLSIGISAPAAIFPQYLVSLGAGVAVSGIVLSLRGLGNLLTDLPGGLLLGRVRLESVMGLSLAVAVVSSLGLALSGSIAGVSGWVLLSGAATSVTVTSCMTSVRRTVPAAIRGRALSLIGGSVRIGALIGPAAGGILADLFGFEAAFWLRATAFLLALLFFLVGRRNPTGEGEATQPPTDDRPSVATQFATAWKVSRDRAGPVLLAGTGILILQLLRASRAVILPLWGESLGLSASLIGTVMSLGAGFDLALFLPAGIIMDRAGRKTAGSLCLGGFSLGILILAVSGGVPGYVLAALLIGLGNGFGAGINMTIGTDLAPNGAISEFLGAWRLIGDTGSTAGPGVAGVATAVAGLVAGGLALAGIGLVGFLIFAFVAPETLHIARRDDAEPTGANP